MPLVRQQAVVGEDRAHGGIDPAHGGVEFAGARECLCKADSLDTVARGVLAQAELRIELPGAIGEGAFQILTGQRQQALIAIEHRGRCRKEGAIQPDLFAAAKQHSEISGDTILFDRAIFELDQPLKQKRW